MEGFKHYIGWCAVNAYTCTCTYTGWNQFKNYVYSQMCYPVYTDLGLEREEIAICPPDRVLGAIGPLNKDHVDVALVRDTLVDTVYLTMSDIGCREEG